MGHPEAGRITFGSYRNAAGEVIFHIRSRARSGTALQRLGFLAIGDAMQTNTWADFIRNTAASVNARIVGIIHADTQTVRDDRGRGTASLSDVPGGGRLMAEWRLFGGWSSAELRARLEALPGKTLNFDAVEEEMTGDRGWHHYHSEAVIARGDEVDQRFARAKTALATYQFSDPAIVVAHFDPAGPLHLRRLLLEIRVWGLRYLCPAVVHRVRDETDVFGFRYDTIEGHFERGIEWFLLTKDADGNIRFRIEARWMRGEFPNWWSRVGFTLLAGFYQRRWHRRAHERLSLLALYGSPRRPPRDAFGLTHQGVDVTFTYHTKRTRVLWPHER